MNVTSLKGKSSITQTDSDVPLLNLEKYKLIETIESLKNNINPQAISFANNCYYKDDLKYLPNLIEQANLKRPNLNLSLLDNPNQIGLALQQL